MRDKRDDREVIIVVGLPNTTIGQKAAVGQGLPNFVLISQILAELLWFSE